MDPATLWKSLKLKSRSPGLAAKPRLRNLNQTSMLLCPLKMATENLVL